MAVNVTHLVLVFAFIAGVFYCYAEDQQTSLHAKYFVSTEYESWYQALINCKAAGMELVSITSEKEYNDLQTYLDSNGYTKGYWLSGTKEGNGNFYWASTGTRIFYTHWLVNQPDNSDTRGENCVQYGFLNVSSETYKGWNDLPCESKLLYICEEPQSCNEIIK